MAAPPRVLFVDARPPWLEEVRGELEGELEIVSVESAGQALLLVESVPIQVLITHNQLASVQDRRFGLVLKREYANLPRVVLAARPDLERAVMERNGFRVDAALAAPCAADPLRDVVRSLLASQTLRLPLVGGCGRSTLEGPETLSDGLKPAMGDEP